LIDHLSGFQIKFNNKLDETPDHESDVSSTLPSTTTTKAKVQKQSYKHTVAVIGMAYIRRPAGSPLVATEERRGLRVLVGAAADEVEEDERDGGHDERDVGLVPLVAQSLQEAGLAGLAVVAELPRVAAPQPAVRVRRWVRRLRPHRRAHVAETAYRRWLAATRLRTHIYQMLAYPLY
jgi:hypothetical protein